ncbi:beta-fructosidase [Lactobacillus selangorensis]|uniref:Beta-fructosidase n=1 Tax=Lactobacillus selangorensis TaxID=81857 RepID=A0A0R2G0J7_9LACO|nr:bacterial Ig-like domain-containing protein [Lactobacillus selangorensis]KRN29697.1 beta-fructosidase [Lactobacillus selangorensis]KRN33774.1 beta-fructosidase [Lactobacillus selangorensis]
MAASKENLFAHNSQIANGATWNPADNFDGAIDDNGDSLDFSKVTVSGSVNTAVAGNYAVTYSYTDTAGNTVSKTVTITVSDKAVDHSTIYAHNSTILNGSTWNAADNFDGATDANGDPVDLADMTVSGTVDTAQAGNYNVTYSYKDVDGKTVSKTVTVTVGAKATDHSAIYAHNSNILNGSTWNTADNFDGATDANGDPVDLADMTVSGLVNTSKPGNYQVTYSYTDANGKTVSKTITLYVVESHLSVAGKDSTLTQGTTWNPKDNFVSATDENGKSVAYGDVQVSGSVDSATPGKYNVVYTYTDKAGNSVYTIITVTVKANSSTEPTVPPTTAPTSAPTTAPTSAPTTAPTSAPTTAPTSAPTTAPTSAPTTAPTSQPTSAPTTAPTSAPTTAPTTAPTSPVQAEETITVKYVDVTNGAILGTTSITGNEGDHVTTADVAKVNAAIDALIQQGYQVVTRATEYSPISTETIFAADTAANQYLVHFVMESAPTTAPTSAPTTAPTSAPTSAPTTAPTSQPTTAPTSAPTTAPTSVPAMTATTGATGSAASVTGQAAAAQSEAQQVESNLPAAPTNAAQTGKKQANALPQTGDAQETTSAFAGLGMTLMGLLGLAGLRRKKHDEH